MTDERGGIENVSAIEVFALLAALAVTMGDDKEPAGTTTTEDNAFTMRLDEALAGGNDVTQVVVVVETVVEEQDGVQVDGTASVTVVEVNERGPDAGDSRSKMEERA